MKIIKTFFLYLIPYYLFFLIYYCLTDDFLDLLVPLSILFLIMAFHYFLKSKEMLLGITIIMVAIYAYFYQKAITGFISLSAFLAKKIVESFNEIDLKYSENCKIVCNYLGQENIESIIFWIIILVPLYSMYKNGENIANLWSKETIIVNIRKDNDIIQKIKANFDKDSNTVDINTVDINRKKGQNNA